jgi:mRNA-degrading endonuclease RelE of RelBE toxin-antitoxin system
MFEIEFTQEALDDIRQYRRRERRRIITGIEDQLKHQAMQETKNRKRLRPNELAEWELRIDEFRVFYDVDLEEQVVKIEAVGYKRGSVLFIRGEEYLL